MRERQEIRMSLEEFSGNGSYGPISVVYCSREQKDSRAILNRIIEDIRNRLAGTHIPSYQSSSVRYAERWISFLENAGPDYMKWQKYNLPSGEFYMHQLIIPHPTITEYGSGQIVEIGRLFNNLFNSASYPFTPSSILRDEIYSIAEIKLYLDKEIFCSTGNGNIVEEYLRGLNINDFLAFSYELDTSKIYNNGSIIKTHLITYNSLAECAENINSRTACIGVYALSYDTIPYGYFKSNYNAGGGYIFKRLSHFKIEGYNNILILYNGSKGRNDLEPLLHMGSRPMTISSNQYGTPFLNYAGQRLGENANMINLFFIDPKNIITRRQDLVIHNGFLRCSVQYRINGGNKFGSTELGFYNNGSNRLKHSYIIPFGDKSKDAIEIVKRFVLGECGEELCNCYLDTIYPQETVTPDNLSEWFVRCTKLSKKNNDGVIMAYKRMKEQLEKEYKEIGAYLDYYNFANCMPVPSLKIDEKVLKNYSKTFHIEPHNVKINIINNKNIKDPISQIRASVTIVHKTKKGNVFVDEVLLDNFYNSKDNNIELGTKKMKGVIYDKIKNR